MSELKRTSEIVFLRHASVRAAPFSRLASMSMNPESPTCEQYINPCSLSMTTTHAVVLPFMFASLTRSCARAISAVGRFISPARKASSGGRS